MSNPEFLGGVYTQSLARRQLNGSIVAALVVAIAFGLTAIRQAKHVADDVAPHRIAVIEHPLFMASRVAAATQHAIETP
jgi:hypothetical protein